MMIGVPVEAMMTDLGEVTMIDQGVVTTTGLEVVTMIETEGRISYHKNENIWIL